MRSGRRTFRRHHQVWSEVISEINDIVEVNEDPEHYFERMSTNFNSLDFLFKSRRGVNQYRGTGGINLRDFYINIGLELAAVAESWCNEAREYMFNNHPWNNRTHNAENGLRAIVTGIQEGQIDCCLYHSVYYGWKLEGANGFRYPKAGLLHIIEPTIQEFGPQLMRSLQGVMNQ